MLVNIFLGFFFSMEYFKRIFGLNRFMHSPEVFGSYLLDWLTAPQRHLAWMTCRIRFHKQYFVSVKYNWHSEKWVKINNVVSWKYNCIHFTFAISVMVFALSISFLWSIFTFRKLVQWKFKNHSAYFNKIGHALICFEILFLCLLTHR